uniref:Uncharacterized protein n=1 Tax=Leptospira ellisii TaxID=2023197 RepID=A0A2N0B4V5_9LEPT|nr:hypothetical protein CH379_18140 [Leptospira ellisii]
MSNASPFYLEENSFLNLLKKICESLEIMSLWAGRRICLDEIDRVRKGRGIGKINADFCVKMAVWLF